eukprot:g5322.t1
MMRTARASLPALLAAFTRTASACVDLQGIFPGGGDGVLDLSVLLKPETLGNRLAPIDTFNNAVLGAVAQCSTELETPIGMRLLTVIDSVAFTLGSMFEPNGVALDVFGDKETSDARRRYQPADGDETGRRLFDMHLTVAILYMVTYVGSTYMPWCADQVAPLMEALGTPLSLVNVAHGDPDPSTDTPWGLAKAYVDEATAFMMEKDGRNADGGLGGKEFNRVPFTGDFFYQDSAGNEWSGYTPKNTPYRFKRTKKWQPLLESDGLGYISTQEHVTPHIGVTARFLGFHSAGDEEAWGSRKLDKPSYRRRHKEVAREVLEASKIAADDPVKQFAISFFDNKFNSLVPLKITYFLERADTLSMGELLKITFKTQLALYNGTILAWREKFIFNNNMLSLLIQVRHDAPRPPSVIRKQPRDAMVEAYAGPDVGAQTIKASEWEPYIRTMPHSEYPSGSSCLCEEAVTAGAELCGGDEMAVSISASVDALTDGDASAAIFNRNLGELTLRPFVPPPGGVKDATRTLLAEQRSPGDEGTRERQKAKFPDEDPVAVEEAIAEAITESRIEDEDGRKHFETDCSNAFNTAKRTAIMARAAKSTPDLVEYIARCYDEVPAKAV